MTFISEVYFTKFFNNFNLFAFINVNVYVAQQV